MIRLIASDLDGTLLSRNDHTIPKEAFPLIRALYQKGILFAPTSGRQLCNIRRLFAPADDILCYICENGALTAQGGEITGTVPIPEKMGKEIIADLQNAGCNLLLSSKTCTYVIEGNRSFTDDMVYRLRNTVTVALSPDEIMEPFIKISGQLNGGVASVAQALVPKWKDRLSAAQAGDEWLDFTVATKGDGIRMLCAHLGIPLSDVAAFGDYYNDVPMLDIVGHPYVMDWAVEGMHKPGYQCCGSVVEIMKKILDETDELGGVRT